MNKKDLIVVVAFCLIATLFITPVLAPAANNLFDIVKDIQDKVNTIQGMLTSLYERLWSADDSIKNDTMYLRTHVTNTTTKLGECTLPEGAAAGFYSILKVNALAGQAAQFTVTVNSEAWLDATLYVWVDVSGKNWADMPALELDLESMDNDGTATFVGNWFVLRVDVNSPPPWDLSLIHI